MVWPWRLVLVVFCFTSKTVVEKLTFCNEPRQTLQLQFKHCIMFAIRVVSTSILAHQLLTNMPGQTKHVWAFETINENELGKQDS